MAQIKEGSKAPKFLLQDKDGKSYGIGKRSTDYTVLYFYPRDNTPGCTIEAKEFSGQLRQFSSRNASVIGISGGDRKTKTTFCAKHKLSVPLVSDTDYAVSKAYGVYGDKKFMGRAFKGIHRKTFIVDKAGTIARVFDSVKPEGHAEEVLEALDSLQKGTKKKAQKPAKPAVKRAKAAGAKRVKRVVKTRTKSKTKKK